MKLQAKGMDVSYAQGEIDWDKAGQEVDFALLRCGFGDDHPKQDDARWLRNAMECTRLGIPFGVYLYSYAVSEEQARSEAAHALRLLAGFRPVYPVFLDLEDPRTTATLSKEAILKIAQIFCNAVRAAGYEPGIYASKSWWTDRLTDPWYDTVRKWVAQYNAVCTYTGRYDLWQYTSTGAVSGVSGRVDQNECYYVPELLQPTPQPLPEPTVTYQAFRAVRGWMPEVTGDSDFAGLPPYPITRVRARLNRGHICYQVHVLGKDWLPEVRDYEDYAGSRWNWNRVDAVRARVEDLPGYDIQLRVAPVGGNYFSWVTGNSDYAGVFGRAVDSLQMRIVRK